ncbi:hypothetical protein B0H17DRAFT_992805 [Mycena rosella]|uniref:Uncharacterized protein n=1 Tax=Mycena rosella TaxID=1033263 RepID=A0AAD7CQH9_MYCRO|nr:hypothetical protein B0H17DRAFT_992805 [Mycena rosella]
MGPATTAAHRLSASPSCISHPTRCRTPRRPPPIPDAWTKVIAVCNTEMIKVPPPLVLEHFGTIRADALKEYQHAQKQLQKALVTYERFGQACDNGAVPSIVSNAMKVPTLQLLKGTPDVESTDADVVNLKGIATDTCDTARGNAADYVRAIYTAQVADCKQAVHTVKCADRFAADLTAYGKEIIQSAQSDGDVRIWDACILRLRTAFAAELTNLSYDFAAKLRSEALDKETKANAVATARTAVETSSAARPIEAILKESTGPLDKRIAELEKQLQSTSRPLASSLKADAKAKAKAPTRSQRRNPR